MKLDCSQKCDRFKMFWLVLTVLGVHTGQNFLGLGGVKKFDMKFPHIKVGLVGDDFWFSKNPLSKMVGNESL